LAQGLDFVAVALFDQAELGRERPDGAAGRVVACLGGGLRQLVPYQASFARLSLLSLAAWRSGPDP